MALQFEEEMRSKLIEYSAICKKIDELTATKTKIRDQAKQWLELNKLDEAYTEDATGQAWKIVVSSTTRKKIDDWSLLKELAGSRVDEIISTNTSSMFKISKIKGMPIIG